MAPGQILNYGTSCPRPGKWGSQSSILHRGYYCGYCLGSKWKTLRVLGIQALWKVRTLNGPSSFEVANSWGVSQELWRTDQGLHPRAGASCVQAASWGPGKQGLQEAPCTSDCPALRPWVEINQCGLPVLLPGPVLKIGSLAIPFTNWKDISRGSPKSWKPSWCHKNVYFNACPNEQDKQITELQLWTELDKRTINRKIQCLFSERNVVARNVFFSFS